MQRWCRSIAAVAATISAACAETVHFSFSEAVGEVTIVANPQTNAPWRETKGTLTAFDIYYDPATVTGNYYSDFYFNDPARSFWRARIESEELGSFVITRPLEVLRVGEFSLQLSVLTYPPNASVELLDFDAIFTERITPAWWQLPGPLLPDRLTTLTAHPDYIPPYWHLEGGRTFFDVPELANAYGSGHFELSQVEVLGRVSPVPESSTFAAAAGTLLGALLLGRIALRRRAAPAG